MWLLVGSASVVYTAGRVEETTQGTRLPDDPFAAGIYEEAKLGAIQVGSTLELGHDVTALSQKKNASLELSGKKSRGLETTSCLGTSPDIVVIGGSYNQVNQVNSAIRGPYALSGYDANGDPYFVFKDFYLYRSETYEWMVGGSAMDTNAFAFLRDVGPVAYPTDFGEATQQAYIYDGTSFALVTYDQLRIYCPPFCDGVSFLGGTRARTE